MKKIVFTLEEIEYLLVKKKCTYLYGFHDSFIKFDRDRVGVKFEKIADGIEDKGIISRDFKGNISCNKDIEEILDTIINVEKYYDINIIDVDRVNEKYRIYKNQDSYVVIEISSNDRDELDFDNLSVACINEENLKAEAEKKVDKLLKYDSVSDFTSFELPTYLYKEITKIGEEKFLEKLESEGISAKDSATIFHRTVNRCSKVISITITDMVARKTKTYMYINGLRKLFCLEFKITQGNNKWIISVVNKDKQDVEMSKIFV